VASARGQVSADGAVTSVACNVVRRWTYIMRDMRMQVRLHDMLASHRDRVMTAWVDRVQGTITPESMPTIELIDHLPKFLDEVIGALRVEAGMPPEVSVEERAQTARGHGEQRLRLGFSLDAVVREYGALRDAIIITARELGAQPTFDELQCVFNSMISGIARAVSEYARQRDAEQQRQHNEHIAFIAHELRNPLASATAALDILKMQGVMPAASRPAIALDRALLNMQEVIDHALSAARVASGIELRREPVQLGELLAEAELVAGGEAESRDVEIHVHLEGDVTLEIDRRLIRSALNNVVRNAVKYTARGTAIDIRSRIDGGHVIIEVEDGCGGLPPGRVEAAFAPFVRLTTREPGFGLGLAIAKQAVDAHAGTIRVQDLPGKGCIFVLELPIEASPS
jgi:signal transduction histidine kinase